MVGNFYSNIGYNCSKCLKVLFTIELNFRLCTEKEKFSSLAPLLDSTRIIPLFTRPNDKVTDFASFPK